MSFLKFQHLKSNREQTFSILIIPKSDRVKEIKLPSWFPKFITIFSIVFLISSLIITISLIRSYKQMYISHNTQKDTIEKLELINNEQKEELITLKSKTEEAEKKLASLLILQDTVKDMVGIKEYPKNDKNDLLLSSNRGSSSVNRNNIVNFEQRIDNLSLMLDKSKTQMDNLIVDVDEKLKFLDAEPNLMPTTGKITSGFGYRANPIGRGREFHYGIDIANKKGTNIKSAGSGVVTYCGYRSGYGKLIVINHGYNYQSMYGHNNKVHVKVGENIKKGQVIAEMGNTGKSTGNHLHFEVRYKGKPINPNNILGKNKK
ncbi:M23 family metallopeptidase [Clostridiisalibacter paucivorans]|uniref:M23 family metallopeptidase n=1 Tax=Clostridiisalibacter paucivorans TaxID=408753 RepID=UPI000A032978|nr:M23 family metallopeptidase [Clostridiisalibacter paucivorans]